MINTIRRCFCRHEFTIAREIDVYDGTKRPVYTKIVLICRKCGHLRKVRV